MIIKKCIACNKNIEIPIMFTPKRGTGYEIAGHEVVCIDCARMAGLDSVMKVGLYNKDRFLKRLAKKTGRSIADFNNSKNVDSTLQRIVTIDPKKASSMISDKKVARKPVDGDPQIVDINGIDYLSITDIDRISDIENTKVKGDAFEEYCARILELNHFTDIKRVGGSGDRGADIIARKGPRKYVIQCKCYKKSIKYEAFQATLSARKMFMADGIIMTNSHFTKQTIEDAEEQGIYLWDREKLIELIENANEELRWRNQ